MSPEQYHLCQLLHRCRYAPGHFEKRFAQHVQTYPPEAALTERQAAQLLRQAHRYRNQLGPIIEAYTPDQALRLLLKALCWEAAP